MSVPRFRVGKRLYLRALEETDVARVTLWMNDRDTTMFLLTGRFPLTVAAERQWITSNSGTEHDMVFAICRIEDDQHIGNCGLHAISWVDRCCVLGIVIGDPIDRGRGYATETIRLLLHYAFVDLNLMRVELSYMAGNERAGSVYKKLGFVEEGRLRQKRYRDGKPTDEVIMSVLRSEWSSADAGGE